MYGALITDGNLQNCYRGIGSLLREKNKDFLIHRRASFLQEPLIIG
jgi:hypothetical protein